VYRLFETPDLHATLRLRECGKFIELASFTVEAGADAGCGLEIVGSEPD
jgi:hypothetical protein